MSDSAFSLSFTFAFNVGQNHIQVKKGTSPLLAEAVPKSISPELLHPWESDGQTPLDQPSAASVGCARHREMKAPCVFTHPQMVKAKGRAEAIYALLVVLKPRQISQH